MKYKRSAAMFLMMFVLAGSSHAADDQTSFGTQAGEAARELRGTASESYAVTSAKVAETAKKVEAEAQDTIQTLQKQWEALAKQLQEKTAQISTQLQKQAKDFNESFNKPPKP